MTPLSRRQFGKVVMVGGPLAATLSSLRLTAAGQVIFGVSTTSFRDLPRIEGENNVDAILKALTDVGAKRIELALTNVEPAPPNVAPYMGGTPAYPRLIIPTPAQVAATNKGYRVVLRGWRDITSLAYFEETGAKFAKAGLAIDACALAYDETFGDAEIEQTFKQATALGANTVSSPMTLATAARLVPFADRYRMTVAIHNQLDGNTAGEIATPQLKDALALSQKFKLKLDIGNLTASNADAVAVLREHQARVSHVLVKDRLRNGGVSQHFGEGDTPIAAALNVLKGTPIPAVVEYDYTGLHSPVEEVTASLAYLTKAAQ